MKWEDVAAIVAKYRVTVQVELVDGAVTGWSSWLGTPTPGYGDVEHYGPFRWKDAKRLLINPVETRHLGQRVPDKLVDHTEAIMAELRGCGIEFECEDQLIAISGAVLGAEGAEARCD